MLLLVKLIDLILSAKIKTRTATSNKNFENIIEDKKSKREKLEEVDLNL